MLMNVSDDVQDVGIRATSVHSPFHLMGANHSTRSMAFWCARMAIQRKGRVEVEVILRVQWV